MQTENDQLELLETRKERVAAAVELMAAQLEKAELELSRTEIQAAIAEMMKRRWAQRLTSLTKSTSYAKCVERNSTRDRNQPCRRI